MARFLFILGMVVGASFLVNADEMIPKETIVSTLARVPSMYLKNPGDWFHITYGPKQNRLREEMITVHDVLPGEPRTLIVGFVAYKDGNKLMVDSYVGNEKEIRIIGTKEVESTMTLDALQLSEEFGWVA